MRRRRAGALFVVPLALVLSSGLIQSESPRQTPAAKKASPSPHDVDWPVYGGQAENDRYSALSQINRANVKRLRVAWTYDTHEQGGLQTSPLIVGRVLYAYSPSQKVIALDAANGKMLWTFDPGIQGTQPDRGLAYWHDGKERRLFAGVMNYLYALDPATGKPIADFGEDGRVDLRKQLRGDYEKQSVVLTTPGIVYKDLIIVGGRNPETHPAPPGDIRAFDVRTGALRWSFHTIPHPGEAGYETWPPEAWKNAGAANNWCGMTLDVKRGILYAPTGSAVFDFYGADRIGNDLYANTLLALDAATGKRLWHFQGVHHDIWDRDFPSPPSLLTVKRNGKTIDALVQTTKQAYVYLFDRVTGEPLFPVEELPYPPSNVPGEVTSPTQPRPVAPEPFGRQRLTEDMLTTRSPAAHQYALEKFKTFRSAGQFIPFTVDKQTIIFPGFDGGAEWGGSAVDQRTGVLYVNENEMAWTGSLYQRSNTGSTGERAYRNLCSVCHGMHREGSPPAFPSLIGIEKHASDQEIMQAIHQGKGRMPGFPNLDDAGLQSLMQYLRSAETASPGADKKEMAAVPTSGAENPAGVASYQAHCAICHGDRMEGISPSFPGLLGEGSRMTRAQSAEIIRRGKGRMPGFPKIEDAELGALLKYMGVNSDTLAPAQEEINPDEMRYQFAGYHKFLDQDGYPAISPPWGTLSAIDMNTGSYLWRIPLGEYPELAAQGMVTTGSENYGGPIVTAGGLVFIGATCFDRKIRAFDSQTGKLLWSALLPFAGTATPATYTVNGKQYVVIAAGGGRDPKTPSGGTYVAFALP